MKMMWGVASNQHAPNPERATMGLFHEGDVVSAIAAAKAKGAPLLVFILGDDPSSAETVRALSEDSNDGSGATLRSEAGAQGWVALRLTETVMIRSAPSWYVVVTSCQNVYYRVP